MKLKRSSWNLCCNVGVKSATWPHLNDHISRSWSRVVKRSQWFVAEFTKSIFHSQKPVPTTTVFRIKFSQEFKIFTSTNIINIHWQFLKNYWGKNEWLYLWKWENSGKRVQNSTWRSAKWRHKESPLVSPLEDHSRRLFLRVEIISKQAALCSHSSFFRLIPSLVYLRIYLT